MNRQTHAHTHQNGAVNGDYVVSVSVDGPVISVRYGNAANSRIFGETITFTAANMDGSVTWQCASGGVIQNKYLPTACL